MGIDCCAKTRMKEFTRQEFLDFVTTLGNPKAYGSRG